MSKYDNNPDKNRQDVILKEEKSVIITQKNEVDKNSDNKDDKDEQKSGENKEKDVQKENSDRTLDEENNNNEQRNIGNSSKELSNSGNKQDQGSTQSNKSNYLMDSNKISSTRSSQSTSSSNTKNNTNSQSFSSMETATYNGSSNNYLENLEIEGLTLNTTFNKENTTYFVDANNITSVNITAIAEERSAKVSITGNNKLVEGQNKILITVTAESGSVRYYRVFVNCEKESEK